MSLGRVFYRTRQFFHAWRARLDSQDSDQVRSALTPAQMALFERMQPGEKAHALSVYRQLEGQGERSPDLLTAALLHDVGKCLSPLHLWERVLIVLGKALFPNRSRRWGRVSSGRPGGWKRAFVVAEQHPAWGAELAAEAGATARTVALIRMHQQTAATVADDEIKGQLIKLQAVDDRN